MIDTSISLSKKINKKVNSDKLFRNLCFPMRKAILFTLGMPPFTGSNYIRKNEIGPGQVVLLCKYIMW